MALVAPRVPVPSPPVVSPRRRLSVHSGPLARGLDRIRQEFSLPDAFPAPVESEAEAAKVDESVARDDATSVPVIAVDPEGSRDLDQAFHIETDGKGFVLHYCIADVAAWVRPGGAIDTEARARVETVYLPDQRVPLHPVALSEASASLLDDGTPRPAIWWRLRIDADGSVTDTKVSRAWVRCREAISYVEAQRRIDAGDDGALGLLARLGPLRLAQEAARGGVSLELPEQEVEVDGDGLVDLRYRAPLVVEEWNAQMSLATGMAAASIMLSGGIGVLRTMPPPDDHALDTIRKASEAMGVKWPGSYPDWVRSLDPSTPAGAVLMSEAARGLRGAGYTTFDGDTPTLSTHSAVAAPYAHVTAPLRRLVDRFGNEVVLALAAGKPVPDWARQALGDLPATMEAGDRRAKGVDRAVVDLTEAAILGRMSGQTVEGLVLATTKRGAIVKFDAPSATCEVRASKGQPGDRVRLRVVSADLGTRQVSFADA